MKKDRDFVTHVPEEVTADDLRKQIDPEKLPRHIAIIMDGNRRWAREKGLKAVLGHRKGTETFRQVMVTSCKLGVEVLTVYAFSKENWKRSRDEVSFLMDLFMSYCHSERDLFKDIGIKFRVVGSKDDLPDKVRKTFEDLEEYTKDGQKMTLNLCVNYGSRDEILQAAVKMAEEINNGNLNPDDVKDEDLEKHLLTYGQPDPDLMIRTSGELRISNFLLWQNAYSEFWFTDVYWPDFGEKHLLQAIADYQERGRRFGG